MRRPVLPLLLAALTLLGGCASMVNKPVANFADNLSAAVYNNPDIESVRQAMPTFLILVDGMIENSPDSAVMLRTGASLYDAYAGVLVVEPVRKKILSERSLAYARRAMCAHEKRACDWDDLDFNGFESEVAELKGKDLPYAYTLAVSWLNWMRVNSDDWNAVADLPRVKALMLKIEDMDPAYDDGMLQLYLGGIATLLPPGLGGKPEEGRMHFEKAIEISEGRNLMAPVLFAEMYARLVFDQELHHRLLTEVLAADPNVDGYVLVNTVAQQQAAVLLASEAEYF